MYLKKHYQIIMLIFLPIVLLSYNHKLRYKNDNVDKYYLEPTSPNDEHGLRFTDDWDDLRTGALLPFSYFSKYNFAINFETTGLTYRGYKNDSAKERRRSDLMELNFLYYFPFELNNTETYFGELNLGIGIKNLIYGNLGGEIIQKAIHYISFNLRPFNNLNYDSYDYRGFVSAAINYSYGNFLYLDAYLDLSYFADYFTKFNLGFNFQNENLSFETNFYIQYQNQIKEWYTYNKVQEAERGIGLFYKLSSKNFFASLDINIENFSRHNKYFSTGSIGIIITPEYSKTGNNLYLLNDKFSFGFDIVGTPKSTIYYEFLDSLEYYSGIATDYSFSRPHIYIYGNYFSQGLRYSFYRNSTMSLYGSLGIILSYKMLLIDADKIHRPTIITKIIMFGLEAEFGIIVKMFRYNNVNYNLKLFSELKELPIVYNVEMSKLLPNYFSFNHIGIGIEIRQ